jgi:hypothetical protein
MWTGDRVRPIVTMTGSHQRTCVFGTLCTDGRQFFRQYDSFNQYTFLDYLKQVQKKFGKLILFIDSGKLIQCTSASSFYHGKKVHETKQRGSKSDVFP